MIVLGLDVETTGLDPTTHRVIEIGAVLWDTDTATPLRLLSSFCWSPDVPESDPEAAAVHGITMDMLKKYGRAYVSSFGELGEMASAADAFVGHNCILFDKLFHDAEMARVSLPCSPAPWIDTTTDLNYPKNITTRKLIHLAAEHGFLNPFAHRALFDVLTMLKVFQQYDAVAARDAALEPMLTLQACVSFNDKQKAKDRGYRWKGETKQWLKSCRASQAAIEKSEAGFEIKEIRQ